jgi:hypothetical protein
MLSDEILKRKSTALENIIPILLGLLIFFIVVGFDVLRFDNIRWLQGYIDSAQHYLGWLFYRYTPWSFPIGSNPNYGLEVSNSILYSDSLPLLAFFFKPFSPFLSEPFQYFGLWYLLCFILQAWFAFRLIGIITDDLLIKACATGLFLFSPPMLNRLFCHSALVGHWLILAALYLCLTEAGQSKKWRWVCLAAVAALTHAYLLAMVMILWVSDTAKRVISRETNSLAIAYEYVLVLSGVLFALWQSGFFLVKSGSILEGYGIYKMNLLSLVNPGVNTNFFGKHSFSYILPELPLPGGEFEGFNYLGLGVIGLFSSVLPQIVEKLRKPRIDAARMPLVVTCFGLSLFAISNKVGIGNMEFAYWIPETIKHAASMLRASGRMFWPVFYLLLWGLIFLLLKFYNRKNALMILSVALMVQAADTRAGWEPNRNGSKVVAETWDVGFKSHFWLDVSSKYKKIRLFPPLEIRKIQFDVAYLAGINKIGTDAAYLARYDDNAQALLINYYKNIFSSGNYDGDTLYVFDENYISYVFGSFHKDTDFFAKIDEYYVVAPGWKYNN